MTLKSIVNVQLLHISLRCPLDLVKFSDAVQVFADLFEFILLLFLQLFDFGH
jgi:hypothetical protein